MKNSYHFIGYCMAHNLADVTREHSGDKAHVLFNALYDNLMV